MAIIIDTPTIHKSLAQLVLSLTPNACVYDNPNQQGTHLPAWFIVHREPVDIKEDLHGRWWLNYHIDLFYMLDFNGPHLFDDYSAIADRLGELGEYLPIYGHENVVIHAFERSWGMYMDALKCSMTFKIRVTRDSTPPVFMEVIEDLRVFLKNQKVEFCTLSFTNDEHPDFSVELPDDIVASVDSFVKLPSVSGEHEEGGELWVPNEWDIGAFGQPVKMSNDITANLLWVIKPQYTLSFENADHPQFDVDLPEPITDYQGEEITLPTVAHQEFEDDGYVYWPLQWDIGAFGSRYVLNQNTDANLLWQSLKLVTITFANPDHPSFAIDLPLPITVRPGESVTLPSVTGEWTEGGITYTPSAWDIGAFGSSYTLNADTVAHLIFEEVQQYEEITLYMASGTKELQNSVTSGFTGNVSSGHYTLYVDEELTTPFKYDYSNDYVLGYYSGDTWIERNQKISDMPDTTTSSVSNAKNGYILLDTGELWLVSNYNSAVNINFNKTPVRIYPKGQQWIPVFPYNPSYGKYDNLTINRKGTFVRKGSPATVFGTFPAIAESFGYKSGMIKSANIQAGFQISQAVLYINVVGNPKFSNIVVRFENDICTGYVRNDKADLPAAPSYDGATYTLKDDNGNEIDYDDSFTYKFVLLLNSAGDAVGGTYSTGTMIKSSTGKLQVRIRSMSSKFNRVWYYRIPISQK